MARLGAENKNTRRATVSPTLQEVAWAAGFLEGEGCFHRGGSRRQCEHISATQVNPEPIDRLLSLFGGGRYQRPAAGPRSVTNHWAVTGSRARGLAYTLFPFMSRLKRRQIAKMLVAGGP